MPVHPTPHRRGPLSGVLLLLAGTLLAMPSGTAHADAGDWQPGTPPLSTPWTDEVGPDNALPDYPRPQLTRPEWRGLNGLWDYAGGATRAEAHARASQPILVPYPPESALSGIGRHDDHLRYQRDFEVPEDWRDQRVLLHFGAVDQSAVVRVNGREVARHDGGYTAFSADITDALRPGTTQHVEVDAEDRNERNPHALGKQRDDPGGILYTGSSGIWQSVWLEPVPERHIDAVTTTSDIDSGSLLVTAPTSGHSPERVEVVATRPDGTRAGSAIGTNDEPVRVELDNPHLWSPDDPYLYDLTVRLIDADGAVLDEVGSYAGMRSIGLVDDERGRPRLALNGRITFQHGPLDQGYWPDGGYTAPTDAALRFDLERTKQLGFNMVRKHVKVEPARWYAWADRIGLLVWQDMPSPAIDLDDEPGENPPPTAEQRAHYESEQHAMIEQLRGFTSVIGWVPFNEGWGEFDTARVAEDVRRADPTRLVDASSGVNCCYSLPDTGAGDIYDDHTYVGPGDPEVTPPRASIDGEYGGLGLVERGHVWPGEPGAYEMTTSRAELTRRYGEVHADLIDVIARRGLSASVYTQTTDVENEVNGLFTYDRRVLKPDADAIREHNRAVIDAGTP